MRNLHSFKPSLASLLTVLACALAIPQTALGFNAGIAAKTSVSTDASDLWWNPAESGWGMQLVQQSNLVFATVFVYGTDSKPTWVTAQLTFLGEGVYSGPLYVNTGNFYDRPFNPAAVTIRQAGTMRFASATTTTGQVTYSIDGIEVSKQVQRQTLAYDNYGGSYRVAGNLTATGCADPADNGATTAIYPIVVAHNGPSMSMAWLFPDTSVCTYVGVYTQGGSMGAFSGTYSCTSGEVGTMSFYEMRNRIGIMSGRFLAQSTNRQCSYSGRFAGINPNVP